MCIILLCILYHIMDVVGLQDTNKYRCLYHISAIMRRYIRVHKLYTSIHPSFKTIDQTSADIYNIHYFFDGEHHASFEIDDVWGKC